VKVSHRRSCTNGACLCACSRRLFVGASSKTPMGASLRGAAFFGEHATLVDAATSAMARASFVQCDGSSTPSGQNRQLFIPG